MNVKKPLKIGLVFNLKKESSGDCYEEYDEAATIAAIQREIKKYHYRVTAMEQSANLINDLLKEKPDFVFNIAEGFGLTRGRESQVPCILESLNIPYFGSDPIALGITLDKYLTNVVLTAAGIPMPKMFMVKKTAQLKAFKNVFKNKNKFIVKPRWEGSSKGIFNDSIVYDFAGLKRCVKRIIDDYHQPAIAEEFLAGDEITAGVYGNNPPKLLGMMRISLRNSQKPEFLYSQENKREWETRIKYEPRPVISSTIAAAVEQYALAVFSALELRDTARIDFRVDKNNIPRVIDVNPLPGFSPRYSDLPILCRLNGISYSQMMKKIFFAALSRASENRDKG